MFDHVLVVLELMAHYFNPLSQKARSHLYITTQVKSVVFVPTIDAKHEMGLTHVFILHHLYYFDDNSCENEENAYENER